MISTFSVCRWCGRKIIPPEYPVIAIPLTFQTGAYYFHQDCMLYFVIASIRIEKEKQRQQKIGEIAND